MSTIMDGFITVQTAVVLGYLFMVRITQGPHNLSFFFLLLLFTKYQHKYIGGGCVILLCVDVCV